MSIAEIVNLAQAILVVGAVIVMMTRLGAKDHALTTTISTVEKLSRIVTNLAEVVARIDARSDHAESDIQEIKRRLERLERGG
jgi:tRNA C32,U32 (ribose-2'-O)-methylase TrmJ